MTLNEATQMCLAHVNSPKKSKIHVGIHLSTIQVRRVLNPILLHASTPPEVFPSTKKNLKDNNYLFICLTGYSIAFETFFQLMRSTVINMLARRLKTPFMSSRSIRLSRNGWGELVSLFQNCLHCLNYNFHTHQTQNKSHKPIASI